MITSLFRSLAFVALFAATSPILAAVTPEDERRAEALLTANQPVQARQILATRIAPSDSAQAWFLLAKSCEQTGDLPGAITSYRQALKRAPNAPRIKLDLARALQQRGDNGDAERLYYEVRASNPPAPVAANIDRFLAMMNNRNQTGSAWRARVTAGSGYDSNPGSATSAREVSMFGLPFALSPEARKRGDGFTFLKGEIDHIYRFNPEFAWASNLTLATRRHFALGQLDDFSANASTGPVWQLGRRTTVLLPAYVNVNRFETAAKSFDDRWYAWETGVSPQVRYAALNWLNLNLTTSIGRRTNFGDHSKNAAIGNVTPGVDFRTEGLGTFSLSSTIGRENAKSSVWSNTSLGGTLGWQYVFSDKLTGSLYTSYTDSRYDSEDTVYGDKRHDRRTQAGADIIYNWEEIHSDVLFSYSHTWNISNIPIYSYDRDILSLAIRHSF